MSCSAFPKCRGRLGWGTLDEKVKSRWEKALREHEKAHPEPVILKVDGTVLGTRFKLQLEGVNGNGTEEEDRSEI